MADIIDPDVIAFSNEKIRVFCDYLVGIAQDIDVATVEWTNTIAPAIAANADGDLLADGSDADGRVQLSKADLVTVAATLAGIRSSITSGALATLIKAKVNVHHVV